MVKKNRATSPAAPVAVPARPARRSSRLTAKVGTRAAQTAAQPTTQGIVPGSPEWLTVTGTYTTSARSRKKAGHREAIPGVPQLPQLGTAATAVPGLVASPGSALVPVQPAGLPATRRPGEQTAEVFTAARRLAWRHRWQLTPVVASAGTAIGAGAVSPVLTVLGLAATAGVGYLTAEKGPEEIAGRVWLSRAERRIMGRWAAGAGVWAGGLGVTNAAGLHWTAAAVVVAAGALGVLTGSPVVDWLKSRSIRRPDVDVAPERSVAASQLIAAWPHAVLNGPDGLAGSVIVALEEPEPGTIVATVQLRADVHAEKVATAEVRQWLERSLNIGVGTAKVALVRDNAGQVRIELTPSRQLEKVSKLWTGPRLYDDGRAPVAISPAGREVCIRLFDPNGVRHLMLIGSSNSGKSNAYNVVLLPLVLSGRSVVLYVDGKRGTSSPEIAGVMDLAALEPLAWRRTIRIAHRVLVAREERYGRMGLSGFDVNGEDPVVELVLDEGRTVQEAIDGKPEERMVEAISERGRALGVSLKIAVQNAEAGQVPGGMNVKTNLMGAGGNVIGLRPGTSSGATMTLSATSEEVDLRSLPEGGGWSAILSGGIVAADRARVEHIVGREQLAPFLDDFTPRGLLGDDLAAADAADEYEDDETGLYSSRFTGKDWLAQMERARSGSTTPAEPGPRLTVVRDRDETTAPATAAVTGMQVAEQLGDAATALLELTSAKGAQSRQKVVDALRAAGPDGATRAAIEAETGLSKAQVNRHVGALVGDELASRDGSRVRLVDDKTTA